VELYGKEDSCEQWNKFIVINYIATWAEFELCNDQACQVPGVLREPRAVPNRHGSLRWIVSLGRIVERDGQQVKLMAGKAFVSGNKNDAADARAIWLAVQQAGVKEVAVKTEGQQAVLALHRMRQQLAKFRTMQCIGLLTEYGETMVVGRAPPNHAMPDVWARLPAMLIDTLRELR